MTKRSSLGDHIPQHLRREMWTGCAYCELKLFYGYCNINGVYIFTVFPLHDMIPDIFSF